MTVTSLTAKSGPTSGDGSTTAFSYTFRILDEDDIVVTLADADGVETVQTLTTHYTVSGVGNASGGTVTMVTAPAGTETVTISRATQFTQTVDLQNRGAVAPETLEEAFDKVTLAMQDLDERLGRAVTSGVSDTTPVTYADIAADAASAASAAAAASTAQTAAEAAQAAAEAAENSLLTWAGAWATATAYSVSDIVFQSGSSYICLVAHTSGTFSTDLSSAYWELFAQQGSPGAGTGDLLASNNLSDLANADTALSNLGGGTAGIRIFKDTSDADIRTQLGLVIGTNVQAYSATLTSWAGTSVPSGAVVGSTDTQTLTNKTISGGTLSGDLGLSIGTYATLTGANSLDPANGLVQNITMTGPVTYSDSMADGESVILHIDDGSGDYAITWPTITWISGAGTQPDLNNSGDTVITVWKVGSTLYGFAANGA